MPDLLALLHDAARGRFPPQDGGTELVGAPDGAGAAILSFAGHHVVAADVPEDEMRERLPAGDLNGPLRAPFVTWLGERLGMGIGSVDVVLAHTAPREGAPPPALRDDAHRRVARAREHRRDVLGFEDERGVVVLGRGLAGRLEISFEVHPDQRGRGAARALIRDALTSAPPGEPVFAQCASANAASLRALLAAGFVPIGGELLLG